MGWKTGATFEIGDGSESHPYLSVESASRRDCRYSESLRGGEMDGVEFG